MSSSDLTPAQHASLAESWRAQSALPEVSDTGLTLALATLRALGSVRRQVRAFLQDSLSPAVDAERAEDVVDNAILVIDELTSNAVRHGTAPSRLDVCDEPDHWIVIATDSAPDRPPTPARDRPAGAGGYGLYLVGDLTDAHGVHYETDRKMVWARLGKPH